MAPTVAKRILVVEDEDAIRETLRYNLAREGYHVLEAATGPDALDVARAERPDLILLDVMLPGLSGLEVCRVLRQESSDADPHAHRQGHRGGQGRRPPARRRRLRHQALLLQRVARSGHRPAPAVGHERAPDRRARDRGVRRLPDRPRRPNDPCRAGGAPARAKGVRPALAAAAQHAAACSPARRSSRPCGATASTATPRPSTCMSAGSARSSSPSRRSRSASPPFSVWATASIGSAAIEPLPVNSTHATEEIAWTQRSSAAVSSVSSVAWRAARAGLSVAVVDPDPGSGASHFAAGMIAPVGEAEFGEEAVVALNRDSAARYPAFIAELELDAGRSAGYRQTGTLHVAVDADEQGVARARIPLPPGSRTARGAAHIPADPRSRARACPRRSAAACSWPPITRSTRGP